MLETGATSTVLTTSSYGSNNKQSSGNKCSLCGEGKGELVPTSPEWQQALWLAEKRIITQIQPQVMSPILARYAAAAYRLRQKPSGWCCSSCAEWVWKQLNDPCQPREVLTPVGQVWPQLGEAAITGPIYFNVDFAQENLTPQGEASNSLAQLQWLARRRATPGRSLGSVLCTSECQVLDQVCQLLYLRSLRPDLLVLGLHHLPEQIHIVSVQASLVSRWFLGQRRHGGRLWGRSHVEVLGLSCLWCCSR